MKTTMRQLSLLVVFLASSLLARSAWGNTATVRCDSQRDQVSVYSSLADLNVAAKLQCGAAVEIIGRGKKYVKIRAQDGVEGYVAETALADLPALEAASSSATPDAKSDATARRVPATPKVSAMNTDDADDIPDAQPANESADPACQNYFSAYGLTPSQMKWIARNRKKAFSNVCPAAEPSKVNFVFIFTHDVNFFNATLPDPVRSVGGFSDFTALTPVDPALLSSSDAEKAHREYVWVFEFTTGSFDPAHFSPHRHYQFTKAESNSFGSKAGVRTVEDAFQFAAAASH
jgi:hypothetical protein